MKPWFNSLEQLLSLFQNDLNRELLYKIVVNIMKNLDKNGLFHLTCLNIFD